MLPPFAERRITSAEAVAENLRAVASECRQDQEGLRARWLQAAQTIDELVTLVRSATFAAKTNHDTLVSIAQAYRKVAS